MNLRRLLSCVLLGVGWSAVWAQAGPPKPDTTAHKVEFVQVEPGVRLEVLDYGGGHQGADGTAPRAMVFLAGLGPDAHVWDAFAPRFTQRYHVFAITRRGFGASDKPAPCGENYAADRLGDDVLAVMNALKLDRPILVGHSAGGSELSSIGSRFPERVAGLIYLDAAYPYAFYNAAVGDTLLDRVELRRLVTDVLDSPQPTVEQKRRLLTSIEANEKQLRESLEKDAAAASAGSGGPARALSKGPAPPPPPPGMIPPAVHAVMTGAQKYTRIPVPILAIYALPHDLSKGIKDPEVRAAEEKKDAASTARQADAFQAALPNARVVRIAHADHYVFDSNPDEVIREMNAFLSQLK